MKMRLERKDQVWSLIVFETKAIESFLVFIRRFSQKIEDLNVLGRKFQFIFIDLFEIV